MNSRYTHIFFIKTEKKTSKCQNTCTCTELPFLVATEIILDTANFECL